MNPQEHARLEDWAKNYAVLALMGFLSFLLILGKVVHYLLLYRGVWLLDFSFLKYKLFRLCVESLSFLRLLSVELSV